MFVEGEVLLPHPTCPSSREIHTWRPGPGGTGGRDSRQRGAQEPVPSGLCREGPGSHRGLFAGSTAHSRPPPPLPGRSPVSGARENAGDPTWEAERRKGQDPGEEVKRQKHRDATEGGTRAAHSPVLTGQKRSSTLQSRPQGASGDAPFRPGWSTRAPRQRHSLRARRLHHTSCSTPRISARLPPSPGLAQSLRQALLFEP